MSLNKIILLLALLAPAAFAQAWSQPVREMEKEARSAFSGRCNSIGQPQTNCVFTHGGTGPGTTMTVPAGKIMVIEDISGYVNTSSSTDLFTVILRADTTNGGVVSRPVSFLRHATNSVGSTRYQAQHPARIYVPAGSTLQGQFGGNFVNGEVYLQGHLVSQQ